ncbi:hypothetical protein [Virgibacillus pantothenticus]|nr:hypothetical protein [Virgibacillus pantothenticus]
MQKITLKQVNDWRRRRIPYLEKAITGNLSKLQFTLQSLRQFAQE